MAASMIRWCDQAVVDEPAGVTELLVSGLGENPSETVRAPFQHHNI